MKTSVVFIIVFITCIKSMAQTTVTGTVFADSTRPLAGVRVEIANTLVSTITDADGRFGISAGEDAVLLFSMNGFRTQEIQVNARNIIDVYLQRSATPAPAISINRIGFYPFRKSEEDKNQLLYMPLLIN